MLQRREFLKKVSLGYGAVTLSSIVPAFSNSMFKSSQSLIVHVSKPEFLSKISNNILLQNPFADKIILCTFSADFLQEAIDTKSNSKEIDALLYSNELRNYSMDLDSNSILKNLPFVNSDFQPTESEAFVQEHLILKKSNLQIGVMGFILSDLKTSFFEVVEKMNKKAKELRNVFGCDMVYCLTDDFGLETQKLSTIDFAEATEGIDQFFSSTTKASRLYVAANKNKEEVFISLSNVNEKEQGVLTLERKDFRDFELG
ncbi:hypothetical protein [Algoriphagus pacificus]|uniref:Uncharacterized protein n=1 Tax=Algoriphagus pacificus TaxID=2811234 RepID=A0ABS3CHB4_9BACT|nr:hypothetical protein [Algoriphagus pacificus]MBN7816487.1 hypothetical protein [Algoriphagus pacificus]